MEELKILELHQLLDMLANQTSEYIKYLKKEGFSSQTNVLKNSIINIQAAIEIKRVLDKHDSMQAQRSPAQDISQPEKN